MIFKLTLGDWECDGYYANKDYFFESNYSAERITEAYKASCRKYGVQFNSAKHDYTGLGRENLDRRRLVWASYDEPSMSREVYRLFVELGLFRMTNCGSIRMDSTMRGKIMFSKSSWALSRFPCRTISITSW